MADPELVVLDPAGATAAALDGGRIVGTVQLGLDTPPNQPHRAEIKRLLVRRPLAGAALVRR